MKKIIITSFVILLFYQSNKAQTNNSLNDSIKKEIRLGVKQALEENNYTRVPIKEFDATLNHQISSAVNNKFQLIYWIVTVLAFILGSSVLFIAKSYLNQSAKKTITESVKEEIKSLEKKMDSDTATLRNLMELKLKDVDEKLENARHQLTETKKEILGIRLERIKQEVDDKKVADETFKSLIVSLRESESLIDSKLISKVLAILSTASYYLQKETEMEKIVQRYIDDENIKLNQNVFINLASGFFYNYYSTSDSKDKEKCLYYINETLRRYSNYGEAYGLKLELLMLDFSKSSDNDLHKKLEYEIKDVFQLATYISGSINSAKEVITRFNRVRNSKEEGSCIDLLEKMFPQEMDLLKKNAANL